MTFYGQQVLKHELRSNNRKEHCSHQTSEKKITLTTVDTKEPSLSNNDQNQANGLINGTSSTKKSSNLEILKVFHQNIRGLKTKGMN
jgi:hypothetical protein